MKITHIYLFTYHICACTGVEEHWEGVWVFRLADACIYILGFRKLHCTGEIRGRDGTKIMARLPIICNSFAPGLFNLRVPNLDILALRCYRRAYQRDNLKIKKETTPFGN